MSNFDGKVVIVTGASRGIGKGIAQAFVQAGAKVMMTSRKLETLQAAQAEIGGDTDVFAGNTGKPDDIKQCVEAAMRRFGAIDVLVNNAFTSPYQGPFVDADLPRVAKTIDVNLIGPLVWIQECWNAHMAANGGNIVNITSGAATNFGTAAGPYGMTKAGLNFLTQHFAVELAPRVRVNSVSPGLVPTDSSATISDQPLAANPRVPPVGRLGTPTDIAAATLFLCSDEASWITGQVIQVDGGGKIYDFNRGPNMPKPARWTPLPQA
jgi:NAD(P)-dependent dehydrogenase (short-subunit alcohol dehydrogenase family)